jgi:hypothetical protein
MARRHHHTQTQRGGSLVQGRHKRPNPEGNLSWKPWYIWHVAGKVAEPSGPIPWHPADRKELLQESMVQFCK